MLETHPLAIRRVGVLFVITDTEGRVMIVLDKTDLRRLLALIECAMYGEDD